LGAANQQDPNDAMVIQDLIWRIKPDLFIEIGTNAGGGAMFCRTIMRAYNPDSILITIDPKDPSKNWDRAVEKLCSACKDIKEHPYYNEVVFLKGFSHDAHILEQVWEYVKKAKVVMVNVDGDHWNRGVYKDLTNYAPMVTVGSYIISQDTKLDRMGGNKGPLAGTRKWLQELPQKPYKFEVDRSLNYLLYSQHLEGYLKRVE
jgi:cephalosporin hydroxylase